MLDPIVVDANQKILTIWKEIKILSTISWPQHIEDEFLNAWKAGRQHLPEVTYEKVDYSEEISTLKATLASLSEHDPAQQLTKKMGTSCLQAAELVSAVGTPEFGRKSCEIYGRPGEFITATTMTSVQAAEHFVEIADSFSVLADDPVYEREHPDKALKEYLDNNCRAVFGDSGPNIQIASDLMSKATAGGKRVRIQAGAVYNDYDFDQLLQHEVFIHSLTQINGYQQPLSCLSLGTPNTTKTQEGLATFSELISGSIDLARLKRIALRVIAIDHALNGADFIEVFRFFLSKGQSERESYRSAARIFRGGFPNQRICFTKDCVYMEGLIAIHTFFRWAMRNRRLDLLELLFCGRFALEDIGLLAKLNKTGAITKPRFVPPWFKKIHGLGGLLAFSLLANKINLAGVEKYYSDLGID